MKSRWFWFWTCIVLGLVLLGCGLLVPAHLRAVDSSVILSAGRTGDSLLERGSTLAAEGRLGAAQLYVNAGRALQMPGWDRLGEVVTNRARQNPGALFWGTDTRLKTVFNSRTSPEPFAAYIVQEENREAALAYLSNSLLPAVQELLRCRTLNHTVLIPPSSSASGPVFDAVVAECGLLLDGNHFATTLNGSIQELAAQANRGGGSQPLEQALMDLGSLGEHFNWDQLTAFVAEIPDAATLHQLAEEGSAAGDRLPMLFAAVQLSAQPAAVAAYVARFPQTGLQDISASLWYGGGGVKALAENGRRLYRSDVLRWLAERNPFGAIYYFMAARSLENPWVVLAVKWLLYLGAGFAFAAAWHVALPPVAPMEQPLQVRGFHVARQFLFALGFLLVVLLLSEPFLAQESQTGGSSLRLRLPMAGNAIPAGIAGIKQTVMTPSILITLVVFFVLQALIYISCLVKLAEIRRQAVLPGMKLKLLENEDHLFDAGLYLGFVGTIVSLIIASLGMVKFSLMAAYSSTSFGIIFVVIFKIFHLRPMRRHLLIEAELADAAAVSRGAPVAVSAPAPTPALTS